MLITLGCHCNISFLNTKLNIKKETGVFEWFQSNKLQYITDVINVLREDPDKEVLFYDNNSVYVLNPGYYSCHYKLEECKEMFKRRYSRFINLITNEKTVYFVRLNPSSKVTTKSEIELFIEAIRKINPDNKLIFLLIDTICETSNIEHIEIDMENVVFHHKYINRIDILVTDHQDEYLTDSPVVWENYKNILTEIGYDINDKCLIKFHDRSEF